MAKLEIPVYKWLHQDYDGDVFLCTAKPKAGKNIKCFGGGECYYFVTSGIKNPNWHNTLIDLDVDDYEFEDGILMRIEK